MSAPQLPGVFATLAPLLDHYGYLAVGGTLFIQNLGWPVSLGQTIFIAGAIYAGAGRLNIVVLAVIGIVASLLGGVVGYLIGRCGGHALVLRYGRYVALTSERLARAEAFFAKRGPLLLIVARFIQGAKQTIGIIAGLTEMPFLRFLFFNTLGALLWVGLWASAGYVAGDHITAIYERATKYSLYLLIALILVVAALVVRYVVRRRAAAADPGESASTQPGQVQD